MLLFGTIFTMCPSRDCGALIGGVHEGIVAVILGEGFYRIELSPRAIGGLACKGLLKNVKKCAQRQRYAPNIH